MKIMKFRWSCVVQAVGFDPNSVPDPTINQNMYETHGRGLYLINQLMDEVRYERGGTEIHMRKK
jgi:serine/threonine-protein kinase RsbW